MVYNYDFKMGQFLGEGGRSDPQKGFEFIPSDDHHTWPASGIAQAAPSNHAQLLHVDLSVFRKQDVHRNSQVGDVYFVRNTNNTERYQLIWLCWPYNDQIITHRRKTEND